jgi:hypothetical protein
MDSIVKDLSFVGKTSSKIGFIISCIISVVLLYLSFVFFTKTDNFITINSNIINVKKCTENTRINKNENTKTSSINTSYDCIITVEYTVNNNLYTNDIITKSNIDYKNFNTKTLKISYNSKNPNEIRLPRLSNTTIGFIFLIIAVIVFGIGYYSNYLSQNSSIIATTQGVNTLASIVGLNKRKY